MKFKTDENLPEEVAESLREAGHEASTILEQSMGGELDPDVASLCRQEQRALITLDLAFADIRTYPPRQYPGLIVLWPRRQSKTRVISVFEQALSWSLSRVDCGSWKRNASGSESSAYPRNTR